MAVSLYFGLPGCGKTTLLTQLALRAVKGKKYRNVYGNIPLAIEGYTYIDNACIGKYELTDGLILIDEGTLFADSRAYKSFSPELVYFFLMHRHFNVDIVIFTQQWDGVDKKIRVITDRVYYVYKPLLFRRWITKYYRIPYGIIIPDKNATEKYGEIVQGYCKPNFLVRLFSPLCFRPLYYKYFDSWDRKQLDALPEEYKPYSMKGVCEQWRDPKSGLPMKESLSHGISVSSCIWTIKNTLQSLKLLKTLRKH